jgi:hypothetical protein
MVAYSVSSHLFSGNNSGPIMHMDALRTGAEMKKNKKNNSMKEGKHAGHVGHQSSDLCAPTFDARNI